MLTQERVKELFEYRDGELYWREGLYWQRARLAGKRAGTTTPCEWGYYAVHVDRKMYKLHRLIFMYHHGYFPEEVDHIDQDPSNNRIENLRAATRFDNAVNRKFKKHNGKKVSKYRGVTWIDDGSGGWVARVCREGKRHYCGYYQNEEDAARARDKKAIELQGEFAVLNFPKEEYE